MVSDVDGAPGAGDAAVMSYFMPREFSVDVAVFGGEVITDVDATFNGDGCTAATGTLSVDGSDAELAFNDCSSSRPEDSGGFGSPDWVGWGPGDADGAESGCWIGYNSKGTVLCTSSETGCNAGDLPKDVAEDVDDTWSQLMNSLEFSDDFDTVTMAKVPIPNDQDSTTYTEFTGTLVSTQCVAASSCN
jgi:hypothetical protein